MFTVKKSAVGPDPQLVLYVPFIKVCAANVVFNHVVVPFNNAPEV